MENLYMSIIIYHQDIKTKPITSGFSFAFAFAFSC